MTVLLLHLDGKLPNLALMLIAAYFRALGYHVELRMVESAADLQPRLGDPIWERVYGSLIFEWTRPLALEAQRLYPGITLGGTGWDFGLPDVDPWDVERDARLYAGPHPVVAHPPCARWSRLAAFCEARGYGKRGDDGGCFAAALAAVRRWGGVLEHPAVSAAWGAFGLRLPRRAGGWMRADDVGGWTCHVDQAHYGHLSIKQTWLYANGVDLPWLTLGVAPAGRKIVSALPGGSEKRRRMIRTGQVQRLSRRQRIATPPEFRDVLIAMAQTARGHQLAEAG